MCGTNNINRQEKVTLFTQSRFSYLLEKMAVRNRHLTLIVIACYVPYICVFSSNLHETQKVFGVYFIACEYMSPKKRNFPRLSSISRLLPFVLVQTGSDKNSQEAIPFTVYKQNASQTNDDVMLGHAINTSKQCVNNTNPTNKQLAIRVK